MAGVPRKYRRATVERVRSAAALEYIANATALLRDNRGVLVTGPIGTGKSSIAALVVSEAVQAGLTARWTYVPDLVVGLAERTTRVEVLRAQTAPDVLVWDDLAVGGLYEWQIGLLDHVVERRYQRERPMAVTSNLDPDSLTAEPLLARFVDRWRERGLLVPCMGESMRRG